MTTGRSQNKKSVNLDVKRIIQINSGGDANEAVHAIGDMSDQVVTHDEIMEFFDAHRRKRKDDEARLKRESDGFGKEDKVNELLRWVEPLQLNRKGHTMVFKSISREKRNNLYDPTLLEKTPHAAYYKPRYQFFFKNSY